MSLLEFFLAEALLPTFLKDKVFLDLELFLVGIEGACFILLDLDFLLALTDFLADLLVDRLRLRAFLAFPADLVAFLGVFLLELPFLASNKKANSSYRINWSYLKLAFSGSTTIIR